MLPKSTPNLPIPTEVRHGEARGPRWSDLELHTRRLLVRRGFYRSLT